MFGDLRIKLRKVARQFFCNHQYQWQQSPYGSMRWRECSRCGRERDLEPLRS